MHERIRLLSIIAQLVKDDSSPTNFPCNTRDIILHYGEWPASLLEELAQEGLIEIRKLDRIVIFITTSGLEKIALVKNQIT